MTDKVVSIGDLKKKKALKGLGSGEYKEVNLDQVQVEEDFNPREKISLSDSFIESIRMNGVQNPIHVRKEGNTFYVVDGHRRYMAARATGQAKIRVIDHGEVSRLDALLLAVLGEDRKSWSAKDYLTACERLSGLGLTAEQVSKVLGKSLRTVRNYLAINQGGPYLKKAVSQPSKKGTIPVDVAASASSLPVAAQEKIVPQVRGKSVDEGLEVVREEKKLRGLRVYDRCMPKPIDYKMASDYKERCRALEAGIAERLQRRPGDKDLLGMQKTIDVLKGKMKVEDAFIRWDGL